MKRIALLGMPNTGKSTFFNRLTGASARIGNWPGITVDLLSAKILLGADMVEVVDLPGLYDLHGFAEDEQVVRRFLQNNPVDLLCIILNATQIDQQLPLALQLCRLGLSAVAVLNMDDAGDIAMDMRHQVIDDLIDQFMPEKAYAEQWDTDGLKAAVREVGPSVQAVEARLRAAPKP